MEPTEYIWQNGEFVAWNDARIHVLTHGLHYGTGVFEGVRCYDSELGPAIFRGRDHYERLHRSAGLYFMEIPQSTDELLAITKELITRNGLSSCYIRPVAFRGYGEIGLFPLNSDVDVVIAAWEWGSYLGEDGKANGIRAKISSWRRMSSASFIPESKANGQYLNSVLAKVESHKAGYDEAILLDEHDHVCEGSGENIFLVRDGTLITPPLTAPILEGITRDSVIRIARDSGFEVIERDIPRDELFEADEVFFTGTAAELCPVSEIDDHVVSKGCGEVSRLLQGKYEDAVHGRLPEYHGWLDVVSTQKPAQV
jgi:branched-chain amino acid aminotransferase